MARVPDFRQVVRFARTLAREYRDTGCQDSAASLTYTTLFAVVPTLTVAWAILHALPQLGSAGDRLEALLLGNLVPASGEQVRAYLAAFAEQASNLTGVGIAFLAVTAVLMLLTIEHRINAVWRVHRQRSLVSSLLVHWTLLTLGPVLIGAGLLASSYLLSVDLFGAQVGELGAVRTLLEVVPFLVGWLFFALLYIAVPNCSVPVAAGLAGGFVAAALFEAAKAAFGFFVTRFDSYELVYGAFAAVPLFLLWVYISWMITLAGVVFTYTLANRDDDAPGRASPFPALLRVLEAFHLRQQQGRALGEAELRHVARRAGVEKWHELREQLLARRIIGRVDGDGLVLVRDLHAMTLAELARLLDWQQLEPSGGAREPDAFAHAQARALRAALAAFDQQLDASVADVLAGNDARESRHDDH